MKKFPIVPIVVVIVAFALSILMARKVEEGRAGLVETGAVRTYFPRLGLDKFVADLKWVKLVQEMGWQS
ncbi:unnamed protein product, partial [marine sediment metagenome]